MELISPYGGKLVNLLVPDAERAGILARVPALPSLQLSERNVCDLELLACGGFSPLTTFMGKADYERVLGEMKLADGSLWPLPITLTANRAELPPIGSDLVLRDASFDILAVMTLTEAYEWDRQKEALSAYGSDDVRHPMTAELAVWKELCISGPIRMLYMPRHMDFRELRRTPTQVREALQALGKSNVVAFQTRNPLHRVHEELTKRAACAIDGTLLIHPVVGLTKPGDVDYFTRGRCYKILWDKYYDKSVSLLSFLPLAMRMAGPKEAVLHAIIRQNYGANHMIVGRDHAGPGTNSKGEEFYGPYDSQALMKRLENAMGVKMIPYEELVYDPQTYAYLEEKDALSGASVLRLSGTQVRNDYLAVGRPLPEWFTRPECAQILLEVYRERRSQGFCLWFTGLSGSGKSCIASLVTSALLEHGRRSTLLDGDVVRTHLSKGLGFSKEDRDTNILRIAFVASEIVRHGGAVIVAAISPYRLARQEARSLVGDNFFEVFVDTPLEVCERRDSKGIYARARDALARGQPMHFTGIDDPYEAPLGPELTLKGYDEDPISTASQVLHLLRNEGFIPK
jgi:sulfate adenylyltransferase